jgi:hypothetical protein
MSLVLMMAVREMLARKVEETEEQSKRGIRLRRTHALDQRR